MAEDEFRRSLRAWLATTPRPPGLRDYGATPTAEDVPGARCWQRLLHDGGWAGLSWPRENGGRAASVAEQAAFAEEMATAGVPRQLNLVGLELAGPMIIRFGTAEQKARFLPPLLAGEEIWCQLFSEPNAGSDLAGIQTRAVPDGDGWVASGQKVWSSGAHYSRWGLLLARTDPAAVRHRGLTCFLFDMSRPGVDVRLIRQMDGEEKFTEVFLTGVRLEQADVLGEVGQGWAVAMSTLGRERLTLGAQAVGLQQALDAIRKEAITRGRSSDRVFRQHCVEAWIKVQLLRVTWRRAIAAGGDVSDPRMSLLKLIASELQREVANLGSEVAGMDIAAGDRGTVWRQRLLSAPGQTLAGGTSEIQRNIIAERVLGLPRA